MLEEVACKLGASRFFPKIAFDLARFPSGVIMRTAEAELLSAVIMKVMKSPILDLACGGGYFGFLIRPDGIDAGCDISKTALRQAAKRKQYRALAQCDATKSLPFPDNYFATVVSNSSLEHMNGIDAVLREIARALKPGGKLIFTLGSNYAYEWWPLSEAAKQQYLRFQPVYNYFSLEEWERRLAAVGLNLVAHQYYLDKAAIQRVMWLDYHFGRVYLTRDLTLARPLIRSQRFVPRGLLARLWMRMFAAFPICVNGAGGGILILAKKKLEKSRMRTEEISIREVGPSDYEMLNDFFRRNNAQETTRHFHPFPLTAKVAKWITTEVKKDRYHIAFVGNQIVGLCMLRGWDEGFTVPSFGIMVDHAFRGRGIGRVMTEHTIKEAKKLGCKQVRLSVYASNVSAYHLYTSLGFREINREFVEIRGEKDEKIVMIKDL